MDFSDFLKYVPKIAKESLPATIAHAKMIPPERIELLNNQDFSQIIPKKAAVLMLLYPKNNITHLALIVRNSYPGIHASQIAFPGGKVEDFDLSLSETALRETHEEIGVAAKKVTLIRAFTEVYIPPSNFLVSPFLGFAEEELSFTLSPDEVDEVIELPLYQFLDEKIVITVNMSTSYASNIQVPAFQINEHLVWGATAMMMSELKEILKKVL
ncbi:NUDIX domain-containing protein [Flavobacterium swingsii]|jgi:8-oxo-dGTP pyrophosphatase MutT (NUDIX family)|uniref:NUDIX domain-containing protein n=1 Tax=Flavobacterium swingsii TaxID=498292 RepID=A0A1I0W9M9_9FLAO|nr:CoA pyrophosphatase [Flavobacterium swingsii]SFA84723.1 NUDIX domain-containing protein [Flavobacterium swingsii]